MAQNYGEHRYLLRPFLRDGERRGTTAIRGGRRNLHGQKAGVTGGRGMGLTEDPWSAG